MTRHASARAPALAPAFSAAAPSRPRRPLACRWERCRDTGTLVCRWEIAGPDLTIVEASSREREQPPSRLPLAA